MFLTLSFNPDDIIPVLRSMQNELIILGVALGCAYGTVATPIIVQTVFGKRDYAAIVGIFTAMGNLGGVLSPTLNGTAYDMFGSYNVSFCLFGAFVVLAAICYIFQLPKGEKTK